MILCSEAAVDQIVQPFSGGVIADIIGLFDVTGPDGRFPVGYQEPQQGLIGDLAVGAWGHGNVL